jgi:hypothetical protein
MAGSFDVLNAAIHRHLKSQTANPLLPAGQARPNPCPRPLSHMPPLSQSLCGEFDLFTLVPPPLDRYSCALPLIHTLAEYDARIDDRLAATGSSVIIFAGKTISLFNSYCRKDRLRESKEREER